MRTMQRPTCRLVLRMPSTPARDQMNGDHKRCALSILHIMMTNQIAILQNNVHKSKERTHSILNDPDNKNYAILILQEQYWSAYTKSSPIHHAWTLIEPTITNDTNGQPRTAIYVNNNLLPASKITPMALSFSDVTAITLATPHEKPSLLVNVYNPCDKEILSHLQEHLQKSITCGITT